MHIDWWTLALQAINFLILVWLLGRFLYRPIVAIVTQRQAAAQSLLDEAAAARQQAEADRSEIVAARQGLATERERVVAAAQARAADEAKVIVAEAKDEAAKTRRDAQAEIARAGIVHDRAIAARAEELALTIAARLLTRLPARDVDMAFLDGLVAGIDAMSSEARSALTSGREIEIVTVAALDGAAQDQICSTLEKQLGQGLQLIFHTDPAVIAGIELRSADIVVRNSWREDLRRIREELASDGG